MEGEKTNERYFAFHIEERSKEQLEKIALKKDAPLASIIRRILKAWLKNPQSLKI